MINQGDEQETTTTVALLNQIKPNTKFDTGKFFQEPTSLKNLNFPAKKHFLTENLTIKGLSVTTQSLKYDTKSYIKFIGFPPVKITNFSKISINVLTSFLMHTMPFFLLKNRQIIACIFFLKNLNKFVF